MFISRHFNGAFACGGRGVRSLCNAMSARKKSGEEALFPSERAEPYDDERVHGRYKTATIFTDEIVVLSQIRPGQNSAFTELQESVKRELLNQIDTIYVNETELEEYTEFTNSLWSSTNKISDFENSRQPDGFYYLLSAGFTRLSAIKSLEERGPENGGLHKYPMDVKVHPDNSIEAYLQRQIDENVKTNPPIERRAMAIAELYYWGVRHGRWSNQKEFSDSNGTMSKGIVSEALAFANLPKGVRAFVMLKQMGFAAAIKLGRVAPTFEDYIYFKAKIIKGEADDDQLKVIEESLRSRLHIEANHLAKKRLNSTASEKRLGSIRDVLLAEMAAARAGGPDDEAVLIEIEELDMYSPNDLLKQMEARDKAEMAGIMSGYGKTPGSWAKAMIELNSPYVDPELVELALRDFQESAQEAARALGRPAVQEAATLT